jgi:hypothetical protein
VWERLRRLESAGNKLYGGDTTMNRLHIALALLLALAAFAPGEAPQYINVRELGAVGDGQADDTQAFLDALARGRAESRHVYVPRGRYRLSAPLELTDIALTGPGIGAWPADIDALPVLIPDHRNGPCLTLGAGGAVSGLCITYEGDVTDGPPAISITGIGCFITRLKIMYAWDGIMTDGKSNVGRLNISDCFLVAIRNVGVRVTGTWDVPALRNIEVWNNGPVPRGLNEGIGFHLGKNDLIRVTDCFVFAMRHGFLLEDKIEGCEIEGGTWGLLTGCSTDFCGSGVTVRGDHTVSITGGTFWEHADSLMVDGEGARVRVTGCELKSNGQPAIVVRDCDHTVITGCTISRPMESFDAPAVVLEGGRTILTGNHIDARGDCIHIGESIDSALIQGNFLDPHGHEGIVNNCTREDAVKLDANLLQPAPAGAP